MSIEYVAPQTVREETYFRSEQVEQTVDQKEQSLSADEAYVLERALAGYQLYSRDIESADTSLVGDGFLISKETSMRIGVAQSTMHRLLDTSLIALKESSLPSIKIWGITEKAQALLDNQTNRTVDDFCDVHNLALPKAFTDDEGAVPQRLIEDTITKTSGDNTLNQLEFGPKTEIEIWGCHNGNVTHVMAVAVERIWYGKVEPGKIPELRCGPPQRVTYEGASLTQRSKSREWFLGKSWIVFEAARVK